MSNAVALVGRVLAKIGQKFLKIGPADEPIAWLTMAATGLLAYQEAVTRGLGPEDAFVGAAIAVIAILVRNDVTPSKHLPESGEQVMLQPPAFPDEIAG